MIESGVKRGEAPGPVVEFNRWLERYAVATPQQRGGMLAEGEALLRARRARWMEFARENPEAAILLSPSEEMRALLPDAFLKSLEKPVAGEGFYGVRASCGHGPDGEHTAPCEIAYDVIIDGRVLEAAIYGSRRQRLTEENASIYGVELDGLIALHEDDVVVRRAATGGFFITHKGTSAVIADLIGIEERLAVFSTP